MKCRIVQLYNKFVFFTIEKLSPYRLVAIQRNFLYRTTMANYKPSVFKPYESVIVQVRKSVTRHVRSNGEIPSFCQPVILDTSRAKRITINEKHVLDILSKFSDRIDSHWCTAVADFSVHVLKMPIDRSKIMNYANRWRQNKRLRENVSKLL
ncbi:hypothetical protein B9Z55_018591 [Caenorhabditis nigoni]|uniref:Uncharacterized protein n=1 Tax=Caenorhabditis nigoni TaxID=1611254 RepID=A0A2G5TET4_9PELO|nr:hypothetical protein B9Z55_018591 [Caenorhabditis nigoni]